MATLGLIVVVFGTVRAGRSDRVAFAVGGYILAAYWFTSSTSFANPAVTSARMFSDTFAGIAPASVSLFVVMQLVGGGLATCWSAARTRPRRPWSCLTTPTVLFVCVHNAGRSQMAAGWLKYLAGDRVTIWSAGSAPADQVNQVAVAAMREVGIDTCPVFPGTRYLDWELTDPAGQPVEVVREVRDEIRARVETLIDESLATD